MTSIQKNAPLPPRTIDEASRKAGVVIERGALQFEPRADLSAVDKMERARVVLEAMRAEGEGSFGGRVGNGVDQAESLRNYYRALDAGHTLLTRFPELRSSVEAFLQAVSIPEDLREVLGKSVEPSGGAQPGPLGAVSFAQDPNYNNFWNRWNQADKATVQVDDATLRRVFGDWGIGMSHNNVGHGDQAFNNAAVRLFARGKELGLQVNTTFENMLQTAQAWPDSPELRSALSRMAVAFEKQPAQFNFHGTPLPMHRGAAQVAARAPGRPLGKDATYENDPNRNRIWQAYTQGQDVFRNVSDATLRKFFDTWGYAGHGFDHFCNQGTPDTRINMLKAMVRAKELGLNVAAGSLGNFTAYCTQNAELVGVMKRWGRAWGQDVSQQPVNGKPIAQWNAAANAGEGGAAYLRPQLEDVGSLGKLRVDYTSAQALMDARDAKFFTLDDASLKGWIENQGVNFTALAGQVGKPEWALGAIKLFNRSVEIQTTPAQNPLAYFQQLTAGLSVALLGDPQVAEALARTMRKLGFQPNQANHNQGQPLQNHPEFMAALNRVDRLLQGTSAPLAPRRRMAGAEPPGEIGQVATHAQVWGARSVDFCRLSDAAIMRELPGGGDINQWMNQIQNAELFRLLARIAEINPPGGAMQYIQAYLSNPVPEQWVTAESLPWIARMAIAGGVPLENVRVTHQGQAIALQAHPANAPALPDEVEQVAQKVDGLVAALKPGNRLHAAEREAALVQALLDEDPKVEVTELLPRLLTAAAAGELERLDLSANPPAARKELLASSLGYLDNPGAQAVLASLLLKAPAADLAAFFQERLPRAAAQQLAALTERLSKLEPKAAAAVLEGVENNGRLDLASIELRIELAAPQVDVRRLLDLHREAGDGQDEFVAVVLTRLANLRKRSPQAAPLLAFLDRALAEGGHDAAQVRAALGDPGLQKASEALRGAVETAVASVIAAPREQRAIELGKWSQAARRLEFLDPGEGARWALDKLHAADLAGVAPLAEADEQLGVVAGRAWKQERVAQSNTADVAGIVLPKATRADRDTDLIPQIQNPFLETQTGTQNLRLLAGRWRTQAPMVLGGPGASEMSGLVPRMAELLSTPYVRVPIGPNTDTSVLFGAQGLLEDAARRGHVVHLVAEAPLAEEVLHGLNAFFEGAAAQARKSGGGDSHFRVVLSGQAEAEGVTKLTRFQRVQVGSLKTEDLAEALRKTNPQISAEAATQLAETHDALATWRAESGDEAGPALDLMRLAAVADRVERFQGTSALGETALVRRELEEHYVVGLDRDARDEALSILDGFLPPRAVEPTPDLVRSARTVSLGDVELPRGNAPSPFAEFGPVVTEGTRQNLYLMMKAIAAEEPIALRGAAGSGRTTLTQLLGAELGKPVEVHLAGSIEDAQQLIARSPGKVLLLAGLEQAEREALKRLRPPEDGALVLEFEQAAARIPGTFATIAVDHLDEPAEQRQIVVEHGKRLGLPEAVTDALSEFHTWVQESYANLALGAHLPAGEQPPVDRALLFDTMGFVAELAPGMGLGPAFVVATETYYGATSDADAASIAQKARELAK